MTDDVVKNADKRMKASVGDFRQKLSTVRTGRASLGILDGVTVDYYGTPTPLNQVAKLSIPEPTLINAQPFDPSSLQAIEKAVMAADLGLNPSNDGKVIRIPIPPLTEERRKQLVKKVRGMGEEAKTAIRQIRRDANEEIKKLEKDGDVSEDDARRGLDEVQKRIAARREARQATDAPFSFRATDPGADLVLYTHDPRAPLKRNLGFFAGWLLLTSAFLESGRNVFFHLERELHTPSVLFIVCGFVFGLSFAIIALHGGDTVTKHPLERSGDGWRLDDKAIGKIRSVVLTEGVCTVEADQQHVLESLLLRDSEFSWLKQELLR